MDLAHPEIKISHHEVFRRPGAFAGWPANYGLWAWGDEVLCVFAVGKIGPKGEIHELDREHAFKPCQARSYDGGLSWKEEQFSGPLPGGQSLSADEHLEIEVQVRPRLNIGRDLLTLREPVDFLDHNTIVMCARTGLTQTSVSWFYFSRDRGQLWDGPFAFTGLQLPLAARTDIVALGRLEALFMLTTVKRDGQEGRVICARTQNGGRSFELAGDVGEEPDGYRIMPSTIRLPDATIVTATRCADRNNRGRIEVFMSADNGQSWTDGGVAVETTGAGGNPPALVWLGEDRLALVYGCRSEPFGIRMRLSADGGKSWMREIIVRSDGGTPDLGYPKVVVLGGGDLLVVYYFNDGKGHERYIEASRVSVTH